MKFDLVEINRLSPPGLWDFGVLVATIAMLRTVIRAGAGGGTMLVYGRIVLRYSESLRAQTRDNFNMRVKAWVLQCPHRIAYVRRIIGAAAIKKWRMNRLADYALSKYFGDWKRKFPNGFTNNNKRPTPQSAPQFTHSLRPYIRKPFALVKIVNVQGFLYRKPKPNAQDDEMRDAYYKLWGVGLTDSGTTHKWTQPRQPRTLNPIRFTPDELEPKAATKAKISPLIGAPDAPIRIEGKVQSGTETHEPLPDWQPP